MDWWQITEGDRKQERFVGGEEKRLIEGWGRREEMYWGLKEKS